MLDTVEVKEFQDDYCLITIKYNTGAYIDYKIDIESLKNEDEDAPGRAIHAAISLGKQVFDFHREDGFTEELDYRSLIMTLAKVLDNYSELYMQEEAEEEEASSDLNEEEPEQPYPEDLEDLDESDEFDNLEYLNHLGELTKERNKEPPLFDEEKFRRLYPSLDEKKENDLKIQKIHDALSGSPEYKEYTEEYIDGMQKIFDMYPNFKEYSDIFIPPKELLGIRTDRVIRMDNILIVGKPSCGKSSFVNRICEIYKNFYRISLGNGSVNFTLMGDDKGYDKSDCGDILRSMFKKDDAPIANPLVILDEIDKVSYSSGLASDFSGTFSILLEKNNAKYFSDNFFKVEVDASNINYIAIANDISGIPEHVLSRFPIKIFVRDYTEEEIETIVLDNQYREWIDKNKICVNAVPPVIPKKTRKLIFECSHGHPREVPAVLTRIAVKSIKNSFASFRLPEKAANEMRCLFDSGNQSKSRKIGF